MLFNPFTKLVIKSIPALLNWAILLRKRPMHTVIIDVTDAVTCPLALFIAPTNDVLIDVPIVANEMLMFDAAVAAAVLKIVKLTADDVTDDVIVDIELAATVPIDNNDDKTTVIPNAIILKAEADKFVPSAICFIPFPALSRPSDLSEIFPIPTATAAKLAAISAKLNSVIIFIPPASFSNPVPALSAASPTDDMTFDMPSRTFLIASPTDVTTFDIPLNTESNTFAIDSNTCEIALPAAVITFTIPENTVLIALDMYNNTCEIVFPAAVITFTIDWRICDIVLPSCCMS